MYNVSKTFNLKLKCSEGDVELNGITLELEIKSFVQMINMKIKRSEADLFLVLDNGQEHYISSSSSNTLNSLRITRFSQLTLIIKTIKLIFKNKQCKYISIQGQDQLSQK